MLEDKIKSDLLQARKKGDNVTKKTLQVVKSAIDNEKIKVQRDLTDAEVLHIVKHQIKEINASIEGAEKAQREDLLSEYKAQKQIVDVYLPKMKTREEIVQVLEDNGAEKGMPMKDLMAIIKENNDGTIDNRMASEIIREAYL